MQDWPLIVNRALDYAARFHAEQTVVSWAPELDGGRMREVTYLDLHRRSRLCSLALKGLGVRYYSCLLPEGWGGGALCTTPPCAVGAQAPPGRQRRRRTVLSRTHAPRCALPVSPLSYPLSTGQETSWRRWRGTAAATWSAGMGSW